MHWEKQANEGERLMQNSIKRILTWLKLSSSVVCSGENILHQQ
jgi:hypothetical protein